jgi:hypothetical protein
MMTGRVESWGGPILDIGPIYPFVGSEVLLFILGLVFWIGWHVLQLRIEERGFEEDKAHLAADGELHKRLDRADH